MKIWFLPRIVGTSTVIHHISHHNALAMALDNRDIPLVFGPDTQPKYNWFGDFDFAWFEKSGNLFSIPFFEATPQELGRLLVTSSKRQKLRLGFTPLDCTTEAGSHNCTEACSDPASLFTPANFRTCTALSATALLVQNGTYRVDSSDAETSEVIDSWGIPPLATFNATGILLQVNECIAESCFISRLGKCEDDVNALAQLEINVGNLDHFSAGLDRYCRGIDMRINPDIAGPGVSRAEQIRPDLTSLTVLQVLLSYFFQTCLAVSLFIIYKTSKAWPTTIRPRFRRKIRKLQGGNPKSTQQDPESTDSWLSDAAISSLAEFQEMQVYFVTSVQIATLVSYNPGSNNPAGANNDSFAAAIINSGTAAVLNITPITGILAVQCALQRGEIRWWYTFLLVTVTFILAIFIFSDRNSLMPPADKLWGKFKDEAPLPHCGGNPSPMSYCRLPRETSYLDNGASAYSASVIAVLGWIAVFVDQLAYNTPSLLRGITDKAGPLKGILQYRPRFWKRFLKYYWLVTQMLLFVNATYQVSVLVLISLDLVGFNDPASWSFGQLIAVTIWAPTVAKFIYFILCKHNMPGTLGEFVGTNATITVGVKRGFEDRISRTFRIIKHEEPKKKPGDVDDVPSQRQQKATLPLSESTPRTSQINDDASHQ